MQPALYGGRRRRRTHTGRGIFGDIGNVLKNIASNVGTKFVSGKLGLGRRRRRRTTGGRVHVRPFTPAEHIKYYSNIAQQIHPYIHSTPSLAGEGRRRRRRLTTGRGIVSSLLGLAGLGRRQRIHHRRIGGSKFPLLV